MQYGICSVQCAVKGLQCEVSGVHCVVHDKSESSANLSEVEKYQK